METALREPQGGAVLQAAPRHDRADGPAEAAAVRSPDTRAGQGRQETHNRAPGLGQRTPGFRPGPT
ncbi:hypothetical protein CRUP_006647 [Coryphaenoides rupestris]|nr:hypothetical protein CRUP_006647 [Coryphaenoides rupestris]